MLFICILVQSNLSIVATLSDAEKVATVDRWPLIDRFYNVHFHLEGSNLSGQYRQVVTIDSGLYRQV